MVKAAHSAGVKDICCNNSIAFVTVLPVLGAINLAIITRHKIPFI